VCKAWNKAANHPSVWASLLWQKWQVKAPPTSSPKIYFKKMLFESREKQFVAYKRLIMLERSRLEMDMRVCRMFHPTNGRNNFERIVPKVPMCQMPSRDELKLILATENELRLDPANQCLYRDSRMPTHVTLDIQKQAVEKHGYHDPWIISSAISYYKDDPELMSIPHYVKFNRSQPGKIELGDTIPNVPLCGLDERSTSLYDITAQYKGMPVILVGGSYT
jgi:hypothetical protein